MAGAKKRRQKYLRKTKAELVDKLEALERELTKQKRTGGGKDDEPAIPLFESEALFQVFVDNVPAAVYVRDIEKDGPIPRSAADAFVRMLAPLAPHLAEELWQQLGATDSISAEAWPEADAGLGSEQPSFD